MNNEKVEDKILLNVNEAANLLRVQANTIRVWLCKGQIIPPRTLIKLGRRVLFNRNLLIEWIDEGCKPPIEEEITDKKGGMPM